MKLLSKILWQSRTHTCEESCIFILAFILKYALAWKLKNYIFQEVRPIMQNAVGLDMESYAVANTDKPR